MRASRLLAVSLLLVPALLHAQRAEPVAAAPPPGAVPRARLVMRNGTYELVPDTRPDTDAIPRTLLPTSDLNVQLTGRLEARTERDRNERCNYSQYFNPGLGCGGTFAPNFDFQFSLKSTGTVADKVHVNVDYDSQREFDASNNISLVYTGRPKNAIQRVELGNVSFDAPASRFITSGIPQGNYGLQALVRAGPFNIRAIAAQQKGNVVQDRDFFIGDSTFSRDTQAIEDWQVEARRFFFTVDPHLFRGAFPNIDLLDRGQMLRLAQSLPDTLRPTRVFLYRLQYGTPPQNPDGPRFRLIGDPSPGRQTYDLLREGVDYYMDPSQLWFVLVRPLNMNERLVAAYNVRVNGRDTVWVSTGGTPDLQATAADQYANLIWDPNVGPSSPAFAREIRSVYRIAGEDLDRGSVTLRVQAGAGQAERPVAGTAQTYLQMFGLAQANNSAAFDVENRLWPRPSDPNYNLNAGAGDPRLAGSTSIIRDYFLVMPSLHPFAQRDSGLVVAGNPTNDAIYATPEDYLVSSSQHPSSVYHFKVQYRTRSDIERGTIILGSEQIRRNSERILLDGVALTRDLDYTVDYDLGRVTFFRPDTLFTRQRRVSVRYEENPLFAPTPTNIFGLTTELPFRHGAINFTAISQSQRSAFTRPQLGFEPTASLVAGVSGQFAWDLPGLTRAMQRVSLADARRPSRIAITGEIAASKPQFNSQTQAYVETFEGQGGITVSLADPLWYFSSLPALGHGLPSGLAGVLDPSRIATMAWQNNGTGADKQPVGFRIDQIDPLVSLAGSGLAAQEQMLWLTLYPLGIGGRLNRLTGRYDWTVPNTLPGRRFRSIRTVLSPTGMDLSRVEYIEFWTLVDTSVVKRGHNPTLIFDFGEVSENSYTFSPETLYLRPRAGGGVDSVFAGKRAQGLDRLDSERDPFTRAFNVDVNDTGLPGDVADTLVVVGADNSITKVKNFAVCQGFQRAVLPLGDTRVNCTVRNSRLDEEDIDQDNVLNIDSAHRESEKILRYVVDLSDPSRYTRVGRDALMADTTGGVQSQVRRQWVLVRVPFRAPDDSLGDVLLRRIKALRITMVSGLAAGDNEFTQLPIDRLRLVGAPWLKRNDQAVAGIAGDQPAGGYVITSVIGTADRDSTAGLYYTSPPGITDELDTRAAAYSPTAIQVNEQSMRILAGDLPVHGRAEAYYRFPSGQQNFMGYEELHLWARGRGHGWGPSGELQFFVRMGRDENNFYLYRTPVNSGQGQAAWLPEVRIQFQRFYDLRRKLQDLWLHGGPNTVACTGEDSVLIAQSALPVGSSVRRYAACQDGYMVYTVEPGVTPPNLAAVQEMAVGFVRVPASGAPTSIVSGDTLELWVDDIRLAHAVNNTGYAGQLGVSISAADLGDLRVNFMRRDPNFRQLGEQPTFLDERTLELGGTLHLEKLVPARWNVALPLTFNHVISSAAPQFLSGTDLPGAGIGGLRTPRDAVTTYTLMARPRVPLEQSALAPVVNNLSLVGTLTTGDNRDEYADGTSRHFNLGVEYFVTPDARDAGLPGASQGVRWNPTQFRLSSGITHNNDRRLSYLQPALTPQDSANLSLALDELWQNGGTVEFQPIPSLTARWDAVSLRDLRQYGDTTPQGVLASRERRSLLGLDVGMERQRSMLGSVSFAPQLSTWLRPRIDFGSQYAALRDPNSRSLVTDTTGAYVLPARVNASQSLGTTLGVDVAKALGAYGGDSTLAHRVGRVLGPVEFGYSQSLLSALDGAPYNPSLGLQLGLGDVGGYRYVNGVPASTAGFTGTLSANHAINLPLGISFLDRYRRTSNRNWIRRLDDSQAQVQGLTTIFPDVNLRWNWRPPAQDAVVSAVSATLGYTRSLATASLLSDINTTAPDLRSARVYAYPVSGNVTWGFGGLNTAAGYTLTSRIDSLPGSFAKGHTEDVNVGVGRSFHIPESWGLGIKNDVAARFELQQTHTLSYVYADQGGQASRLVDNGRSAISLNATNRVSDGLDFTLQLSRVITYDNNLNRRLNQFVLSTVLQFQFFSGPTR
ncbi:MAG TPA: cell surface protein SprA [Gemmatimonadaceae bacterium]|nr:cell surface protein SprA [Gemmatimonadaceae bacterium]